MKESKEDLLDSKSIETSQTMPTKEAGKIKVIINEMAIEAEANYNE